MNDLEGLLTKLFITYPAQAESFEQYVIDHHDEEKEKVFYEFWEPVNPILVKSIKEAHKCMRERSC